ncbi:MAG: AmmeMemoRadiSam system protein B [Sulfurimonas sp.]|nr:AmmeMemoRadiSam system protein B [Sulfurimonas sp.]
MRREMSVAGAFYPARDVELERYFQHFTQLYEEEFTLPTLKPKAVIVPHAGYIYSGYTANIAYRLLALSGLKNFVVIGPSHRVAFEGVSMCEAQSYATPFGNLDASRTLYKHLQESFALKEKIAHQEHSTEVQFPFIKHYCPDAKIVELVYGRTEASTLSDIIDEVLSLPDSGVIISTDLSHFYTLEEANQLDRLCVQAVESLDISLLHRGCEACGILGVEGMLLSAKRRHLKATLLDYRTSADASDDTSRVVGYLSAAFS